MPASDFLNDSLLASIRRRGNIPSSSEGWNDADLLAMATDEMRDSIVPMLRRLSEEYLVNSYDVNIVSGTSEYQTPTWALGEVLRDVQLLDGSDYVSLRRIEPHEAANIPSGSISAYFLRDDRVTLVPTPNAAVTSGLRMKCLRRPGKLIPLAEAFAYVSYDGMQTTISPLDGSSSASVELAGVTSFDVIQARIGFRTLGVDLSGSVAGATLLNISGGITANVTGSAVGDYIVASGTSPAPQIPVELHPLLAQATVCAYLRASGGPGLEAAEAKRAAMEAEAINLFTPRTENQPRYVINRHGAGWGPRRFGGR